MEDTRNYLELLRAVRNKEEDADDALGVFIDDAMRSARTKLNRAYPKFRFKIETGGDEGDYHTTFSPTKCKTKLDPVTVEDSAIKDFFYTGKKPKKGDVVTLEDVADYLFNQVVNAINNIS